MSTPDKAYLLDLRDVLDWVEPAVRGVASGAIDAKLLVGKCIEAELWVPDDEYRYYASDAPCPVLGVMSEILGLEVDLMLRVNTVSKVDASRLYLDELGELEALLGTLKPEIARRLRASIPGGLPGMKTMSVRWDGHVATVFTRAEGWE